MPPFGGHVWVDRGDVVAEISRIKKCISIRGFTKFSFKVAWSLQFMGYLRILSLKFQKARTKIELVLSLPWWLSQFS